MKRAVLAGVMLLAGTALVSALGLSVFTGGGFGFGMDLETGGTDIGIDSFGKYLEYDYKSWGAGDGAKAFGEVDLELGDWFSIGIGGGYVWSWRAEGSGYASFYDTTPGGTKREVGISTRMVPLFLTLRVRKSVGRFDFYFGAGPSTCLLGSSTITDKLISGGVEEYWEIQSTYTPGWGYHGVAGVEFRLAKRISLRVEVRGEQLTFWPKKAVITTYTVDGVDQLMTAYPDVYDRETIFVQDLPDFLNSPVDPNAPDQDLVYNISADSFTAFVGIVWRLF